MMLEDKLHTKNNENPCFLVKSHLGFNTNFFFQNIDQTYRHYPFNTLSDQFWYVFEIIYNICCEGKGIYSNLQSLLEQMLCSNAKLRVYIFSMTLLKDTELVHKPGEFTWYLFLFCRPLNIVFKRHYPKPRNRYWVADHYKNVTWMYKIS